MQIKPIKTEQDYQAAMKRLVAIAEVIGFKGRVSEILNRKRKLSINMIRRLHEAMQIPTDVLVQEY